MSRCVSGAGSRRGAEAQQREPGHQQRQHGAAPAVARRPGATRPLPAAPCGVAAAARRPSPSAGAAAARPGTARAGSRGWPAGRCAVQRGSLHANGSCRAAEGCSPAGCTVARCGSARARAIGIIAVHIAAMWIDTHCHLDAAEFDADRDAVVARARAAGVAQLVLPAVAAGQLRRRARAGPRHGLAYALGIHPLCVDARGRRRPATACARRCSATATTRALVAVGEIGLDHFVPGPRPRAAGALLRRAAEAGARARPAGDPARAPLGRRAAQAPAPHRGGGRHRARLQRQRRSRRGSSSTSASSSASAAR